MSTQIQIQRSTAATTTPTLLFGELGYSTRSSESTDRKGYLWIGDDSGNTSRVVGGDHFVQMLDHNAGTLTANSALIAGADGVMNSLKVSGVELTTNELKYTANDSKITITPAVATPLKITDGTVDYVSFVSTTDDASMSLDAPLTGTISFKDNVASALSFKEGTNEYMKFDTRDDAECVVISKPLNIGSNALSMTGDISGGNGTFSTATGAVLTLVNETDGDATGNRATKLLFTDNHNNEMGKVIADHDSGNDDAKGRLRFFTGSGAGNTEEQDATEALEINSAQKSIFKGDVDIGTATTNKDLTVHGNFYVEGTTTTLDSTTVSVADKNLEIGSTLTIADSTPTFTGTAWTPSQNYTNETPTSGGSAGASGLCVNIATHNGASPNIEFTLVSDGTGYADGDSLTFSDPAENGGDIVIVLETTTDASASGGGVTLKGTTDKTIIWDTTNNNWTFDTGSADGGLNLDGTHAKDFKIANASVLNATTLGSAVVNSSLTNVGTLTALTVSGIVNNTDDTQATNSTTGALKTAGGLAVVKNAHVGGTLDVTGASTLTGAITAGGALTVAGATTLNSTLDVPSGLASLDGGINVADKFTVADSGNTVVEGTFDVTGAVNLNNATQSSSSTTGALIVDGGAGIAKNANVGGNLAVTGTSTLTGNVSTAGTLDVTGTAALGATTITSGTATTIIGADITFFDTADEANPSFSMGDNANDALVITSVMDSTDKDALSHVKFNTLSQLVDGATENGTQNDGAFQFWVDNKHKFGIVDGGMCGFTASGCSYILPTDDNETIASRLSSSKPYLDNFTIDGGTWEQASS
tara:strand:+ start:5865 stop:8318 length:2454 start_codon:yes stop_codon:yes gene_type:complete